jgi:rRNA-processing protein FCF1
MKKILLDTNFILSCIRNKIDFFEEIFFKGYNTMIPESVIEEIKSIKNSKKKLKFRREAEIALEVLSKNNFEKIILKGKNVDNSIINYAKENPQVIIATLDKDMQNKIINKKMVIRNQKKIEII